MEIGFLHSHITIVTLFLLFLLFKTILLLAGKKELLAKVRTKGKMADPILGTLMLITGGYLLSLYDTVPTYLWVKAIIVILVIPIGIIAFKKENKILAVIGLLLTVYIYGVAEAGSLTFSKQTSSVPSVETETVTVNNSDQQAVENGKTIYLAECKKCHGTDGKKGLFKAPDLTKSELTLEEKVAWIKAGKGVMPAYEDKLSQKEIEAVAVYLEELK